MKAVFVRVLKRGIRILLRLGIEHVSWQQFSGHDDGAATAHGVPASQFTWLCSCPRQTVDRDTLLDARHINARGAHVTPTPAQVPCIRQMTARTFST